MKLTTFLSTALLALSGCMASEVELADSPEITAEQMFRDTIVGKDLVNDTGSVVYSSDGTFSGTTGGQSLEGRWQFQSDRYCVVGNVGGRAFPAQCQNVIYDGDEVTFDGREFDVTYTITQ